MAEAFVSLATNDEYAKGAIVLGQSLRENRTSRRLALMITNDVSQSMRDQLGCVWDSLEVVSPIDSGERENLILLQRPDLGITFTKLQAWRLIQYKKCVFLDADTLVLDNVDELFEREELSAAPDVGWPDCFNSGVFVFVPSLEVYSRLIEFGASSGSFDGGDQGLLNSFFSDWSTKDIRRHLPFIYNVTPNVAYGYTPAFKKFGKGIKIIHFIGAVKPWHHQLTTTGVVFLKPGTYASQASVVDYIQIWWDLYIRATNFLSGPKGQSSDAYTGTQITQGISPHTSLVSSINVTSTTSGNPNTPISATGSGLFMVPPSGGVGQISVPPSGSGGQISVPPSGGGGQISVPPSGGGGQISAPPLGQASSGSGLGTASGTDIVAKTSQQAGLTVVSIASTDELRKAAWMRGQPDYLGEDKFENRIKSKLDAMIQGQPPPAPSTEKKPTGKQEGKQKEEVQEVHIVF